MLVLDQRDAHMIVTVVAKADARRDGDLRLLHQALGEFDRAELRVELGQLVPVGGPERSAGDTVGYPGREAFYQLR